MIEKEEDIRKIYNKRIEKDKSLFFIDKICVSEHGLYKRVKRKKLFGIDMDNEEIIPPVFDDVTIYSESVVLAVINNIAALFNLKERKFVSEIYYDRVEFENDYLILNNGSDDMGIYDTRSTSFLYKKGYELANVKDRSTEYIWVKRGRFYDFIRRKDGLLLSMAGLIMAYDTEEGLYGMDENHKVSCFDEYGVEDIVKFRSKVISSGGYLRLQNRTFNIEDIVDIYGNKLN